MATQRAIVVVILLGRSRLRRIMIVRATGRLKRRSCGHRVMIVRMSQPAHNCVQRLQGDGDESDGGLEAITHGEYSMHAAVRSAL
jgi:hypothetical protein